MARSTTSTPASLASRTEAALMPLVSCVWKWMGRPISSFSALTSACGGVGAAEPGHVLDGEEMGAHLLQFLGQLDVVLERILVAARVEDVAGVADGGFADGVGFLHGLHGDPHVGQRS